MNRIQGAPRRINKRTPKCPFCFILFYFCSLSLHEVIVILLWLIDKRFSLSAEMFPNETFVPLHFFFTVFLHRMNLIFLWFIDKRFSFPAELFPLRLRRLCSSRKALRPLVGNWRNPEGWLKDEWTFSRWESVSLKLWRMFQKRVSVGVGKP